ncbi:transmembrane amino acid transporter protein-domain-containing protein [Calycina marina]|uniref:Transmembrane amino acid transporter protein-domain-containing protein n=1 Tax=Calycina marina TaxID=1763456 RepID=A0A9P7Z5P5_9HELO|nr:transmembrane amino acid transporter protein-domain-containing protein [Calycina marina]
MSTPRPVPMGSSPAGGSRMSESPNRAASIARLSSPISQSMSGTPRTPQIRQIPAQGQSVSENNTPLAGAAPQASLPGQGVSALTAALSASFRQDPPKHGTPPLRSLSPVTTSSQAPVYGSVPQSLYGSFDKASRTVQGAPGNSGQNTAQTYEDPEIVRRHLIQPENQGDGASSTRSRPGSLRSSSPVTGKVKQTRFDVAPGLDADEFSSLRLQGGDTTRPIYRWAEDRNRVQRSQSFHISRPEAENDAFDIGSIKMPGGFRRNFLRRSQTTVAPTADEECSSAGPKLLTNNFIEFLTLYGHFAGEELEEDDEDLQPNEYFGPGDVYEPDDDDNDEPTDRSALLTPGARKRARKPARVPGTNGPVGAALLLLKSFVGTGVLFLPKAYLNGGMLFSNIILLFVAALSYYCFVLLVNSRLAVDASFGDIGGILYGKWMRTVILFSIVISQIGFVAAYIVFTSENLQAFFQAVTDCADPVPISLLILAQMAFFLPFSLLRDISKLGFTALIADAFILIGLVYLYYYDIYTIAKQGGISDIVNFNPNSWTLFIGTAIFTFEGIGLIIPIQESMQNQKQFPKVLGLVMIIITFVFISMGALSYAAYGSATKTVVILNLPQDSKFVNAVQFLYSCAILLSTPLQIFPAIKITENELFTRSGKYNPFIKWQKNVFRFFFVIFCAGVAWIGANDLDKFVALVGSFACVPLVYIYPPMLHYKAVARNRAWKIADVVLCVFGLIVMVYTTALTVLSWVVDEQVIKQPSYCDQKKMGLL